MGRDCVDCFYYKVDMRSDRRYCAKHSGKKVSVDTPACSDFLSDDNHDCCDCAYLEPTTFSFKCTRTGEKIKSPSSRPVCSKFVEE